MISETKFIAQTEEDRFFCKFGGMFYTSPLLLQALVRKCHDETIKLDAGTIKMTEDYGLMFEGIIPSNIKQYVLEHFKMTEENGISMHA